MVRINLPGMVLSFFGILVLISGSYVIYSGYFGPNYDTIYNEKTSSGRLLIQFQNLNIQLKKK